MDSISFRHYPAVRMSANEVVPLLELRNVSKSYPGEVPVPVLKSARLQVARGERIAILGPSGSGKSTILNLLGTLDRPDSGSIHFDGRDLSTLDARELAQLRNRRIGFVFQSHHLLPQCTVLENVLLPTLAETGTSPASAEDRARQLLDRVGLGSRTNHVPGQLSGGERQRTAVVRALINSPLLVLADEPTGALDQANAEVLGDLLVGLNRDESVTLIVVTHSPDLARRMDRIVELRDGALVTS
ncbi:MAG: ABC transporter ATP-binding protein [Verrucomicrobiales bacterium]|nr:ABC transporter ATP-binding protein [Verrucomicrobiales bacterium]